MSDTLVTTDSGVRLRGAGNVLLALLLAGRPKQWTKNIVLFVGLVFSFNLFRLPMLFEALVAFAIFCALSSAGYLVNDVVDLPHDRNHPSKSTRPLAMGRITVGESLLTAALLLVLGMAAAIWLKPTFAFLAALYVALSISYSLWLKKVVLVDVFAIAAGFVIRAAAGAVAISVPISPWLYVCTILGALFIALGKRRHELQLLQADATNHRATLEHYSIQLLDQLIIIVCAATIMAYSLYTFSAENLPKNHAMMATIPVALYGIFRYLYLLHVEQLGGAPEDLLVSDTPLLLSIVAWGGLSVAILYFFPR